MNLPAHIHLFNQSGEHDRGIYYVDSSTRLGLRHRVDVEELTCDCEGATKGIYWRMQQEEGKQWSNLCGHLKDALAAHGLVCVELLKNENR